MIYRLSWREMLERLITDLPEMSPKGTETVIRHRVRSYGFYASMPKGTEDRLVKAAQHALAHGLPQERDD